MLNDADAAGVAEMTFGAGRGRDGVVIMLTFGTGIGSGLFVDGHLVPNTELGHIQLDGHDAESRAAASAAQARRPVVGALGRALVNRYIVEIVKLFSPELIIVGGGASKRAENWVHVARRRGGVGGRLDGQQRRHRRRRPHRPCGERQRSGMTTFAVVPARSIPDVRPAGRP